MTSLPTTPHGASPTPDATHAPASELTRELVRAHVVEILGEDVEDDADLFDAGLDSVRLMTLAERWRAAGSSAGFLDLVQRPTLTDWYGLVVPAP